MEQQLRGKIASLPEEPGVWLRGGGGGRGLYLGKADSGPIFGHPQNCRHSGRFEKHSDLQIKEGLPKVSPKSDPEMAKGLGAQTLIPSAPGSPHVLANHDI